MPLPLLVVVTGPPGAGKTTVATLLRERLGLPLLAKDALKEVLAEQLGVRGRPDSQRLGGAVFEGLGYAIRELLEQGVPAIVEGNFTPRTAFLRELPPARVVQVHVDADPETLRARLAGRRARHPVHYDAEAAVEIAGRAAAGEWEPLPLDGPLLRLDATHDPPLGPFVEEVAAAAG